MRQVFLQRQTVGLTHTQDPPTISLPTIATFFRVSYFPIGIVHLNELCCGGRAPGFEVPLHV